MVTQSLRITDSLRLLFIIFTLIPFGYQQLSGQLSPAPFAVGIEHQLDTNLGAGGSFSKSSLRLKGGIPIYQKDKTLLALSASYQFESYNFSDISPSPWENIHRTRVGLAAKSQWGDWDWIALPWVNSQAEADADFGESLTFGGIAGGWRKFGENFTLGFGAGFSSRLEDSVSVFPILVIDWQLTDSLTFSTFPESSFQAGPKASFIWQARDALSFSLGYQYFSNQHRLAEQSATSPDGIGEHRENRISLASTYKFDDGLSITTYAGLSFGGELEIQNASGSTLNESDIEKGLVIGALGSLRF